MADLLWIGAAQARSQLNTVTITGAVVGAVYAAAINGKSASYTAITGDTTTTIATGLQAACAAARDGEFTELAFAASGATVTATGPTDGSPFVMTVTVTSTGTATNVVTTTGTGPADVANVANYSTGALPALGDRLIVENTAGSLLYNLDTLAAVTVSIVRRGTHAGTIGLPHISRAGYREYRPTHLAALGLTHTVETTRTDGAGAVRLRGAGATGGSLTVVGVGASSLGAEPVELHNVTAWTVSVAASGVSLANNGSKTIGVGTLRALNSAVTLGPGATVTTAVLTDCTAAIAGAVTNLSQDRGGSTAVVRAGGVSGSLTIDAGEVSWQSTTNPPAAVVGSGGTLTFAQCPAAVTAGTLTLSEGATVLDPAARLARPLTVVLSRTEVSNVTLDFGTQLTLTVS